MLARFHDKIAVIDMGVMLIWGESTAKQERRGRKLPAMDSLIAAIALHGDFVLVTRNERDFEGTGVSIVNGVVETGKYPATCCTATPSLIDSRMEKNTDEI